MPAKNVYHSNVIQALIEDGWVITHDPLTIGFGGRSFFVDLGAERTIGAEKAGQRIAVEVQSFVGRSEVADLERALGQFILYESLLGVSEPERKLFMAVHKPVAEAIFAEPVGRLVVSKWNIRILVFDEVTQRVVEWIE